MNPPRLVIAGTGGDSGKTLISIGLAAHWRSMGLRVQPFKKGPDYIDSAWLTRASGIPCRNLDIWMMGADNVQRSFTRHAFRDSGINLIEGNRGLYDGDRLTGNTTAGLAKLLNAPVVAVLPVGKVTQTAAALVLGLKTFDPEVRLAGVILNRVGGERQLKVIRSAVEDFAGVPVLGAIPRLGDDPLPGRHLGLVTPEEHTRADEAIRFAERVVNDNVDTAALGELAKCSDFSFPDAIDLPQPQIPDGRGVRIACFHSAAFTFYYPENLEALEAAGAEIMAVDPLTAKTLPECNALYIGGGFPETHARRLAENRAFLDSVKLSADNGLPVWAECGGLMFLAKSLQTSVGRVPMAGVLDVDVAMHSRPQGHGYEEVLVEADNPFLPVGIKLRGHEFHYSQVVEGLDSANAFRVLRGVGIGGGRDGLIYKNVLASYLHVHALGSEIWVKAMINAAKKA